MSKASVIGKVQKGISVLTLNNAKQMNAVSNAMCSNLREVIQEQNETNSRALILEGSGKAFCAGGDLKSIRDEGMNPNSDSPARQFYGNMYNVSYMLHSNEKPVLPILTGFTMGAGVGLSAHTKFSVATENTILGIPQMVIGLIPDDGASHSLPKMPYNIGYHLGLTGSRLSGKDVVSAGYASHFISSGKIEEFKAELANEMELRGREKPENVMRDVLNKFNEAVTESEKAKFIDTFGPCEEIYDLASTPFENDEILEESMCQGNIRTLEFIDDIMKQISNPSTTDSAQKLLKKTKKTIDTLSPTSLSLTLHLLPFCEQYGLTLKQVLGMEHDCVQEILNRPDFFEGIRCTLVDREDTPKWSPAAHADVSLKEFHEMLIRWRDLYWHMVAY
eukprot:TRINITY_DN17255_c0_g1_i1.p1 TRINITY_DN17255_c0_g1~~TRINITY_DN17255_c0_g1_i1.p1  ORF type:complete len:391 (-),score=112.87 TRINITY_DN17255_c0_g1_i1:124-1296(-)